MATGAREHRTKKFLLGKNSQVVTQSELERMLSSSSVANELKEVVMIQCAGSRGEELPYCSKICCGNAVKNALKIKEINPETNVYVLYRDMRTYGFTEDYYREAREKGIIFIRYEKDKEPEVIEESGQIAVKFTDPLLDEILVFKPDILALSVGTAANDVEDLAKILKIPVTQEGFFLEAHVKLRPVEFSVEGIYLCGLAHFPKPIEECIAQAKAAAAKAAIPLTRGFVSVEPIVSSVIAERCIGCGVCESLCPYTAIRLIKVGKKKKAQTISASCKGCGICAAHCPKMAISMGRFRDEEICAQIDAFLGVESEK
jgi:heterodisulfide reductase subunit A